MTTLSYTATLTVTTCWCGMEHAIPQSLYDFVHRKHNDGEDHFVYCPLGHKWTPAGKSKVEIERERVARLERTIASREEDLRVERASHAATKGSLTKHRKRAANGVCPCCKRSFVQLARHMKGQHPDFVPSS